MKKGDNEKNDFREFLEHLEYLGYEILYTGDEAEDKEGVHAVHHQRPNLWVFRRFIGVGVSVGYGMGQNAVTYVSDYLKIINEFNKRSIVCVFYTNADAERPNINICAMFAAPYDKRAFGVFMDEVHKDHDEMRKISEFNFYAEDTLIDVVPKAQVS